MDIGKDFFGQGLREVGGHLSLNDNDIFEGKILLCVVMQATTLSHRGSSPSMREVDGHPCGTARWRKADSLQSYREITGSLYCKDHNDGNHYMLLVMSTAESQQECTSI